MAVHSLPITNYSYTINAKSAFESPLTANEKRRLIHALKLIFRRDFFNDPMIRLDGIYSDDDNTEFEISGIEFFDFLTTNYTYFKRDVLLGRLADDEKKLVKKVIARIEEDDTPTDLSDLLCRQYLANGVAVSTILYNDDAFLLTRRSSQVGIANNYFSVSSTGTCGSTDITKEDPFKTTCVREVEEELGLIIPKEDVHIDYLVAGVEKLQPVIVCNVFYEELDKALDIINKHNDFGEENSLYVTIAYQDIQGILCNELSLITEVARFHLESLKRGGGDS